VSGGAADGSGLLGQDQDQEQDEDEQCSVWLPPRSLLVLSGTVRYGW
jgi:hypothetical protein